MMRIGVSPFGKPSACCQIIASHIRKAPWLATVWVKNDEYEMTTNLLIYELGMIVVPCTLSIPMIITEGGVNLT